MTIFGDKQELAFEIEPLDPSWERRSIADRGPWARLGVYVQGRSLTRGHDPESGEILNGLNVPLLPSAEWFVKSATAIRYEECPAWIPANENLHRLQDRWRAATPPSTMAEEAWEDEQYDWYTRHFWRSGCDGLLLPDVAFARIDEQLWLSWSRDRFAGSRQVEFSEHTGTAAVDWASSWSAIGAFVAFVAERTRQLGNDVPEWVLHTDPIADLTEPSVESFLGFVAPDAAGLADELALDRDSDPEASVALQAARDADLRPDGLSDIVAALQELESLSRASALAKREQYRAELNTDFTNRVKPELRGYDAALWLRRKIGLDGGPIATDALHALLSELAVESSITGVQSTRNDSVLGAQRRGFGAVVFLEHARMGREWAKRMEVARAIGHLRTLL